MTIEQLDTGPSNPENVVIFVELQGAEKAFRVAGVHTRQDDIDEECRRRSISGKPGNENTNDLYRLMNQKASQLVAETDRLKSDEFDIRGNGSITARIRVFDAKPKTDREIAKEFKSYRDKILTKLENGLTTIEQLMAENMSTIGSKRAKQSR